MTHPEHKCDECGGPLDTSDVAAYLRLRILEFQDAYPDVSAAIRPCSAFVIGSDIGGSHPKSRHVVFTFALVACDSAFSTWQAECDGLRRKHIPDGRRMSFKGLNDNLKRRALRPFLLASDQLNGVLISIIVEKGIERLFQYGVVADLDPDVREGVSAWKPAAIEQALRLSHVVGLLMTSFSSTGQSGIWIADEDEAFANSGRVKTFCAVCDNILAGYERRHTGTVLFGTPETLPFGATGEDLLALADLAAGTLADWMPGAIQSGMLDSRHTSMLPVQFDKGKVNYLLGWYSGDAKPLKRLTIIIRPTVPGRFDVSSIKFF